MWKLGAAVLAGWSFAGCGIGTNCSTIGCVAGVTVAVHDASGAAVNDFEGTIDLGQGAQPFKCPNGPGGGANCRTGGIFVETTATKVTLDLHATGGSAAFSGDLQPAYADKQFGTEECPLVCKAADATITLQ